MTLKLGITGGIGSGKSVVSRLLGLLGIPVYISDTETKQLMVADECIRRELTALLGNSVYSPNGSLNKQLLASYIFGNHAHIAQVNAIVHPRVKLHFRQWVHHHGRYPLVGMESAILFESGFAGEVDRTVMVYAPHEVRIRRAMERDAASRQQIESRIHSQMDDEEKRRLADYVIVNDDETPLIPQVLELITSLSKNNPYLCGLKNNTNT